MSEKRARVATVPDDEEGLLEAPEAPGPRGWEAAVQAHVARHEALQGLDLGQAARALALARDDLRGAWAYAAWDDINHWAHRGRLPTPLILWINTEWGGCLGDAGRAQAGGLPLIRLHPGLLPGPKVARWRDHTPWHIDQQHRGYGYAYDVHVHESVHVRSLRLAAPSGERSVPLARAAAPSVPNCGRHASLAALAHSPRLRRPCGREL